MSTDTRPDVAYTFTVSAEVAERVEAWRKSTPLGTEASKAAAARALLLAGLDQLAPARGDARRRR